MKSLKKINYTKGSKIKIEIKRMEMKIEIKNKLEGNYKFLIGGLN
jgi:predicted DNA-binding antitoxin AbrB/MazE fold protein